MPGGHVAKERALAFCVITNSRAEAETQRIWSGLGCSSCAGHTSQFSALLVAEKLCTRQGAHVRSAVLLAVLVTCCPAAQLVCFAQKPLPARSWNSSAPHARHVSALLALEKVPASHGAHTRSDVALAAKRSRSPGMQVACFVHEACPASGW